MSKKTMWLGNVPEQHHGMSAKIDADLLADLGDLLSFIQEGQPHAEMDHLIEEVIEAFCRRKDTSLPGPLKRERLSVKLPASTHRAAWEVIEAARKEHDDESIGETELLEHAIAYYLDRSAKLNRAWKKERAEQAEHDFEDTKQPTTEAEVHEQPTTDTSNEQDAPKPPAPAPTSSARELVARELQKRNDAASDDVA